SSACADSSAGQELQHTRSTQGEPIVFPPRTTDSHGRLGDHRGGDGGIRTPDFTASPDRPVPPVSEELLGLHRAFGLTLVLRLTQGLPLVPFALALGQS